MSFKKSSFSRAYYTRAAAILFALCAIVRVNYAQETSPSSARLSVISGTVFDVKEALIPKATVTLINCETKEVKKILSSEEGGFLFEELERGIYDLTAEWTHFKKHERPGINLQHSDRQHFNLTLEVRSIIHVEPPVGYEPLNTTPSKIVTSLSTKHTPSSLTKTRKTLRRKIRRR